MRPDHWPHSLDGHRPEILHKILPIPLVAHFEFEPRLADSFEEGVGVERETSTYSCRGGLSCSFS
jgi:hypothetical protein